MSAGRPLYRLVSVPFLHSKPTWGDVIVAKPDKERQFPRAWDRRGVPFERIAERIHEDGGRYAAILDYEQGRAAQFQEVARWLEEALDVVAEGCFGPRDGEPGRMYMAVPDALPAAQLLARLQERFGAEGWIWVHPSHEERLFDEG
jgi:hypothetical protein